MATDTQNDGRTVLLKRVRLSFTESLKDKQKSSDSEDAKPKHGCNLIIEQVGDDAKAKQFAKENIAKCIRAMEAAGEKQWKDKDRYKGISEDAPKRVCFRRGERFKNREGKVYAGYEGNFAITASGPAAGQKRPKLLDRHKRDVGYDDIADVMYGGSYCDAYVSFFGTDKGSQGIFASIELIRSHQEGEAMGGGFTLDADALDALDDLDDDTPSLGGDDDLGI